jgi:hypothetical protein
METRSSLSGAISGRRASYGPPESVDDRKESSMTMKR